MLYQARIHADDGALEEVRVRVKDIHERKAKGDAFWNRVFKKKS
jgi:hypothetical protein